MKEIKKCPFCGGNRLEVDLINVEHTNRNISIPEYVVRNAPPAIRIICRDCLCSMTKTFGVKIELFSEIKIINEITDELIDKWNNRAVDAETQLKAERINRLDEWQKDLDDREDSLNEREHEIDEKVQIYMEIRDEMAKLLKNIDDQNNKIYKRINDLLENTEDKDGDAPLKMLNLTLSTIKNSKNNTTEQS